MPIKTKENSNEKENMALAIRKMLLGIPGIPKVLGDKLSKANIPNTLENFFKAVYFFNLVQQGKLTKAPSSTPSASTAPSAKNKKS